MILTSGLGAIVSNDVTTRSSFQSNTFNLTGTTRGGPPTTYTWTRNGVDVTRNSVVRDGSFAIYMRLKTGRAERERLNPGYVCILTVTGDLPGVYEYTVYNRAMTSNMTQSINIQGMTLLHS